MPKMQFFGPPILISQPILTKFSAGMAPGEMLVVVVVVVVIEEFMLFFTTSVTQYVRENQNCAIFFSVWWRVGGLS